MSEEEHPGVKSESNQKSWGDLCPFLWCLPHLCSYVSYVFSLQQKEFPEQLLSGSTKTVSLQDLSARSFIKSIKRVPTVYHNFLIHFSVAVHLAIVVSTAVEMGVKYFLNFLIYFLRCM